MEHTTSAGKASVAGLSAHWSTMSADHQMSRPSIGAKPTTATARPPRARVAVTASREDIANRSSTVEMVATAASAMAGLRGSGGDDSA